MKKNYVKIKTKVFGLLRNTEDKGSDRANIDCSKGDWIIANEQQ
jgi:hypothetical protein